MQLLTGFPSIDKPWLKYYSQEAINGSLPECTIYEYIWANNRNHLHDIALRYYGRKITYGQLFENIKKTAVAFSAMGVVAGDTVTIMSMPTPETITAIYALNCIGATVNLVYLTLSEHEILYTLQNTESKLFLIFDIALKKIEKIESLITIPIIVLGIRDSMPLITRIVYSMRSKRQLHSYRTYQSIINNAGSAPTVCGSSGDAAVIVYTSGTTGEPKGVVLSNRNLNAVAIQCTLAGKNYQRGESTFFYLPPFTGYGIAMLHLALSFGIDITIHLGIDVQTITKEFLKSKPNRIAGGPTFADALIRHGAGDLSYLIDFTGGGAALSSEKEHSVNLFLKNHGSPAKYTNGYGMTEFASVVCMQMNHIYKYSSLGIPLPKANVKIVDPDSGKELCYFETGEMCFSAPNTMIGYFKNSQATNEIIEIDKTGQRWLHTGDLGYVDKDGFVFFAGRLKRVYLARDENGAMIKLFPQRIEEFLENQPGVNSCGVIVVEDAKRLHVPIVFITGETNVETMNQIIEKGLPNHLHPVNIHILHAMPLTANGKIDYRALEEKLKNAGP